MRTITWKVRLRSSPAYVYSHLAGAEGRRRFWAERADESGNEIEFRFVDGSVLHSRIIAADPGRRFQLTYFDGSIVTFRLDDDGHGGTDLVLTEEGVSEANWSENGPGWVSVLLNLKAVVDHGVDLRGHDPERTWKRGYIDA